MAGITYLGQVGSTGTSTGPHKHVYVKDLGTGQYINPATIRSALAGIRVGEGRVPALLKTDKGQYEFNPAAGITLTSKFGPRSAPTKGASSYHQGEDWALPEGTPVYFEGAGTYKPAPSQGGFGNLATFITADNKYEIGLGHMKSLAPAAEVKPSPGTTTSSPEDATLKLLTTIFGQKEEKQPSFTEQLIGSAVAQRLAQPQSQNFLSKYSSMLTNPYEDVLLNPSMLELG